MESLWCKWSVIYRPDVECNNNVNLQTRPENYQILKLYSNRNKTAQEDKEKSCPSYIIYTDNVICNLIASNLLDYWHSKAKENWFWEERDQRASEKFQRV